MAAVRRSTLQKRIGWRMDYHTAARVHVGSIWKRYPKFTAKQVLEKLGSQYPVGIRFVQRVLKRCWVDCGMHSRRELRVGRRVYGSWRGRLSS